MQVWGQIHLTYMKPCHDMEMALYHPLPSEVHHNTHDANAIPTAKPWYNNNIILLVLSLGTSGLCGKDGNGKQTETDMQTWKVMPKVTNVTCCIFNRPQQWAQPVFSYLCLNNGSSFVSAQNNCSSELLNAYKYAHDQWHSRTRWKNAHYSMREQIQWKQASVLHWKSLFMTAWVSPVSSPVQWIETSKRRHHLTSVPNQPRAS